MVRWDGDHGLMSPEEERRYIAAWSQPHAFKSMVNWYRAAVRVRPLSLNHPRITVPMLLTWGDKDQFLDRSLAEQSMAYCDSGRLVHVPEASHWIHDERPGKVATLPCAVTQKWVLPTERPERDPVDSKVVLPKAP